MLHAIDGTTDITEKVLAYMAAEGGTMMFEEVVLNAMPSYDPDHPLLTIGKSLACFKEIEKNIAYTFVGHEIGGALDDAMEVVTNMQKIMARTVYQI